MLVRAFEKWIFGGVEKLSIFERQTFGVHKYEYKQIPYY